MTVVQCLCIAIGGCLGAVFRFGISVLWNRRFPRRMPYGTLTVNLIGSLLLGLVIGMSASNLILLFFGVGFLGSFTTFSTVTLEMLKYYFNKQTYNLVLYGGVSCFGGLILAFSGILIGQALI